MKWVVSRPKMGKKWVKNSFFHKRSSTIWDAQTFFLAHCEPKITCFGPWKRPKSLENGPLWDQKWIKTGSKTCSSVSDPGPLGVHKHVKPRAVRLRCVKEPSNALQLHNMSEKWPKKAPKSPKICAMCTDTPKPSMGRILGYVAQNPISRAPSPPATPRFLWFPSLKVAQREAQTPVPVVHWWSRRAAQPAHGGGQQWIHQCPRGEKRIFFQSSS